MKKSVKLGVCIFITMLFPYSITLAQENIEKYPTIDKPCPEFNLTDVQYYKQKQVSLNNFRGKWLILDCWNRYCSVCLSKMPTIDSLQRKYAVKVQFLLVGYTGYQYTKRSDDKAIRKLYDMNRKRLNLDLPIAYDSVFFHRFNIGSCPYIIIIDPNGIIKGITWSLTGNDIDNFLADRSVSLKKAYRRGEQYIEN